MRGVAVARQTVAMSGPPVHLNLNPAAADVRLGGLAALARAVGAARDLQETIELAAEETRRAIGAGSLSISRVEPLERRLRVLVNVGHLAPEEERFPADETYTFDDYPAVEAMLLAGASYTTWVDDPDEVPVHGERLRRAGRSSEAAVPIIVGGRAWGELWAATREDQPPLGQADLDFLEAAALYVAGAVSLAEHLARLERLAFEDPLTGLANRRALDDRLEAAVAKALVTQQPVSLLVLDIDRMKDINDRAGHAAGDEALLRVARALREATHDVDQSFAARVGGDEFCLLLEGRDAVAATAIATRVLDHLRLDGPDAVLASCGVGTTGPSVKRSRDLFRAADAAQYAAKRRGGGRITVARSTTLLSTVNDDRAPWRRFRDQAGPKGSPDVELLNAVLRELDGPKYDARVTARLEAVAMLIGEHVDAHSWVISKTDDDGTAVRSVLGATRRQEDGEPRRFAFAEAPSFRLVEHPVTAEALRAESSFVVDIDDPEADPAELAVLEREGARDVLGTAARSRSAGYLLEIYGDASTAPLASLAGMVRVLALEAVHGGSRHRNLAV